MRWVLLGLLMANAAARGIGLTEEALDGPDNPHSVWIGEVLKHWPASRPAADSVALRLTCMATAGDDRYVGMLQQMSIRAPLQAAEQILDDVPHYKDVFPGVLDVRVIPELRRGDSYVTAWKQQAPVFFLPPVVYELAYLVDKTNPGMGVYRYKLRRGESLLASDGVVVLEAMGSQLTRFTEYDFFNARWGPLPASAVWRESLRGAFLSDTAIRLRAENGEWSFERINHEAERLIESETERIKQCYTRPERIDFDAAPEIEVKQPAATSTP